MSELAGNNILNINKVLKKNVHEMHIFLAHKIDKQNLEAQLRKHKGNVTEL